MTGDARDGVCAQTRRVTGANLEKSRPWSHEHQSYIIGVLVFLISITTITEHPEWFN
jgi:hypothetical protein